MLTNYTNAPQLGLEDYKGANISSQVHSSWSPGFTLSEFYLHNLKVELLTQKEALRHIPLLAAHDILPPSRNRLLIFSLVLARETK